MTIFKPHPAGFLFAGVVVRDIGHGTQGDLELLQEDLSDEGFKVLTFS